MALLRACRRPCQAGFRSLSTATTAEHKPHAKPGGQPHHESHVHKSHVAHGTVAVGKFHLKPEARQAEMLKMSREIMPAFVASAPGLWGLPGPRSLLLENHHNEWMHIGLWESANAMEAFKKSPEHDKLMHKFGALIDFGEGEQKEQVSHADFHYYGPMRQCHWERYPVEISEWKVKPGFRKQVKHLITENESAMAHCHKIGLMFQVLIYSAAEDHVVAYSVYRDLLKWEAGQQDMEKHLAEWGLADFIQDVKHEPHVHKHEPHVHIHHHHSGTLHSNAWVYSE